MNDRVVKLVEAEILRKEGVAKLNNSTADQHLEVANALRIVLEAYKNAEQ